MTTIRSRKQLAKEAGLKGLAENPHLSSLSIRLERMYLQYYKNQGLPCWAVKYHGFNAHCFFEEPWARRLTEHEK